VKTYFPEAACLPEKIIQLLAGKSSENVRQYTRYQWQRLQLIPKLIKLE
jgi:hypothetical protein